MGFAAPNARPTPRLGVVRISYGGFALDLLGWLGFTHLAANWSDGLSQGGLELLVGSAGALMARGVEQAWALLTLKVYGRCSKRRQPFRH
jgi:hypothetical protein